MTTTPSAVLTAGALRLDAVTRQAQLHGHIAVLSPREVAVLAHLIANREQVSSSDDISTAVWGHTHDNNTIAVHVKKLRAKLPLDRADGGPLIWTVRGIGYRLAPVLVGAATSVSAIRKAEPVRTGQTQHTSVIIESMNAEGSIDVERRAAMHAALADPNRLRIVDHLSLGDASPSELQAALSMASNLLAHHLKVLEDCGLVQRDTSHADRRRTYVRLSPSWLGDLLPRANSVASRVVFVCTQNSARSQLATALWGQRSSIPATSAGTHPAASVHPDAVAAARRHQLSLTGVSPQLLSEVIRPDDLIVVVCDNAHEHLPADLNRLHWSVPDPVASARPEAFDDAIDELSERIDTLAQAVTP